MTCKSLLRVIGSFTFILSFYSQYAWGQVDVCGEVVVNSSGDPIPGVHLVLDGKSLGYTDNEGRFCIPISSNTTKVLYSHIGYIEHTQEVNVTRDTFLLIRMSPKDYLLPGLSVKATELRPHFSSVVSLPMRNLEYQPVIFGEADPIKSLSLYAGVATGAEGSSGIYVRGGTPDQNLYLLDDVPLYNTNHLFGYLSTINPKSTKAVSLYKGFIPSNFGGRASSVIDIVTRHGNENEFHWGYDLGVLSNTAYIEGPIRSSRSSYMLSTRLANLSVLSWPAALLFKTGVIDDYASYGMYDLNTKLTFKLSESDKLTFSAYGGQDNVPEWHRDNDLDDKRIEKRNTGYGHFSIVANYQSTRKRSSNKLSAYYTKFINQDKFINGVGSDDISRGVDRSSLQEWAIKQKKDFYFKSLRVHVGFDLGYFNVNPNHVELSSPDYSDIIVKKPTTIQLWQIIPHVSSVFDVTPSINVNVGLRASNYINTNFHEFVFEPRISLSYTGLGRHTTIEGSFTKLSQPLHLLTSNSFRLLSDIWLGSSKQLPSIRSTNWSIGVNTEVVADKLKVHTAAYYRTFENLIDYRRGAQLRFDANEDYLDKILSEGHGIAKGVELQIETTGNNFSSILSATIGRSERKFSSLDNGRWIRTRYDRLLSVDFSTTCKLRKGKHLSSNVAFSTGYPYTQATGYVEGIVRGVQPYFTGRLNSETPNYWRMDVQFNKEFETRRGKGSWSLGVYNVFAYFNPVKIELIKGFRSTVFGVDNSDYVNRVKKEGTTYFRFVPYASISRDF